MFWKWWGTSTVQITQTDSCAHMAAKPWPMMRSKQIPKNTCWIIISSKNFVQVFSKYPRSVTLQKHPVLTVHENQYQKRHAAFITVSDKLSPSSICGWKWFLDALSLEPEVCVSWPNAILELQLSVDGQTQYHSGSVNGAAAHESSDTWLKSNTSNALEISNSLPFCNTSFKV